MDLVETALVEDGVSVRFGQTFLSFIGRRWSCRLCLNFIGGRWGECVLEADFVEAALMEDGASERLGRTLLKLH